jgi:hypothetical protein
MTLSLNSLPRALVPQQKIWDTPRAEEKQRIMQLTSTRVFVVRFDELLDLVLLRAGTLQKQET